MAQQLRLANYAQSSTLSILSGTFRHRVESWQTMEIEPGIWQESMEVVGKANDANLTTWIATLDSFIYKVYLFKSDPLVNESIWLEANADGETAKRALVVNMTLTPKNEGKSSALLGGGYAIYTLTIDRKIWEDVSDVSGLTAQAMSALGGEASLALGSSTGTDYARITTFDIANNAGTTSNQYRIWAGILPAGTTNFVPKWELELATLGTDATLIADADASGSSNNAIQVDFATTATMAKRATIILSSVSANYSAQKGDFLVLLRAKCSDGSTTCDVILKSGYQYDASMAPKDRVLYNSSSYRLKGLGNIAIPPVGYRAPYSANTLLLKSFTIEIWAERLSGSANLVLDCLILIPSKHMLTLENAFTGSGATIGLTSAYMTEEDELGAVSVSVSGLDETPRTSVIWSENNWHVPMGGGLLVMASERETVSNKDDQMLININYDPRWINQRSRG